MKSGSITQDAAPLAASVAPLPKSSRSIPIAIPAATSLNGQIQPAEVPLTFAGDRFYVRAASAEIYVQSIRAGNVGIANQFSTGQGQTVKGGFETLQLSNKNLFPIVALVWVGFEEFINDQLVLDNSTFESVVYETASLAGTLTTILIPDKSGLATTDANGKKWLLVNRQAVLVSNPDTGATIVLQARTTPVSTAPFPGFNIYPQTSLNIPAGGDFSISAGGGLINASVWEIYNAISAS